MSCLRIIVNEGNTLLENMQVNRAKELLYCGRVKRFVRLELRSAYESGRHPYPDIAPLLTSLCDRISEYSVRGNFCLQIHGR